MLRAYFDRSEFSKHGVVVVAGYLSHVDLWDRFEPEWRKILSLEGLEFFHMTDYVARQGPYKGWSERRRLKLAKQLIGIINHTALLGSAVGLCTTDLDVLLNKEQRKRVSPYGLCATLATVGMMRWVRDKGSLSPIACVFESGDEGGGQVTQAFSQAKQRNESFDKHLLAWSFENKRNVWELQAADLLAYESARQFLVDLGLRQHPVRQSLLRLVRRTEHIGGFLDAESLRKALFEDEPSDGAV